MGAALKMTIFLLIVACAMIATTEAAVRIGPCDQVCPRIVPERHECCRAHGRSGYAYCSGGGMYCN
uniref:Diapause-specific peptide n=1 Tax=Gastrophysa atrocyanea TaxID=169758 RepID=DIAP_GASAT|nr:RecName: Full=Diapause-specific peptide; Short=DSP; AltName: Full=Diapausin; Flags: Precursor [Gastrophysa atrocyanea]BAB88222.1 Diapausin [Gastrophysa atrocyanea]